MSNADTPLAAAFRRSREQNRTAIIPFIVAGDPDLSTTRDIIRELVTAGADMLELGIPYSDPLADGPSIVAAAQRALASGVTFDAALDLIADVPIPVVVFTYANPVVQYGVERLAKRLAAVNAAGMIVPDLPLEETIPIAEKLAHAAIEVPLLITPTTKPARAQRIVSAARGFIYLVSRLGVTGAGDSQRPDPAELRQSVDAIRALTELPIAIGFGLSRREQIAAIAQFADGAIVGSALVDAMFQAGRAHAAQAAGAYLRDLHQGSFRTPAL